MKNTVKAVKLPYQVLPLSSNMFQYVTTCYSSLPAKGMTIDMDMPKIVLTNNVQKLRFEGYWMCFHQGCSVCR